MLLRLEATRYVTIIDTAINMTIVVSFTRSIAFLIFSRLTQEIAPIMVKITHFYNKVVRSNNFGSSICHQGGPPPHSWLR